MENAKFIEDVEYGGNTRLRSFVFEEKYVIILTVAIENDQEQQQPQLEVPLRGSTKERRTTILDYYIVYLQEHEFGMGLEDDPISFSQAKQSVNS
ncbi:hypothetical protein AAG906_038367 [Vitis piasezkii]